MLDLLIFFIGIGGFGLAGYLDLKYTEFPDLIPYGMIGLILTIRLVFSVYTGNFSGLIESAFTGLLFLGVGLGMYFTKQWGDGDAWLLGVFGFIFPNALFRESQLFIPPYISVLLNFFLIAFVYLITYSLALGINKPQIRKAFSKKIKGQSKVRIFSIAACCSTYFIAFSYLTFSGLVFNNMYLMIGFPILIIFLVFYLEYAKIIESHLFKRKVLASKLRVGDVVLSTRWKGLTETDVRMLKKRGGHVWIKEGIRFAPVFAITLVFSVLFGAILI